MAATIGKLKAILSADDSKFAAAFERAQKSVKRFDVQMRSVQRKLNRTSRNLNRTGKSLTTNLTLPLVGLGGVALKTASDFETLQQQLNTLTGSAEEGERVFTRLKELSAGTPFQLPDLVKANNTLLGFSLSADEAFTAIKNIGDIAAVTGGDIQSIAVAFGQSAAEGKLFTKDIRQLINQGVPAVKMLADTMGVAENQVFELASEGKISFEILSQAFEDATSKGGMFEDGMAKQSKTLAGLFSTLKDNVNIALASVGQSISEAFNLKELIPKLTKWIQNATTWFNELSDSTKRVGIAIAGIAALAGPALVMLGGTISALGVVIGALTSPITLTIAAIAGLAAGIVYLADNWKAMKERLSDWGWWRNMIVDMTQFLIEYSPISLFIKQVNALLGRFSQKQIPNIFEEFAGGLEHLKVPLKDFEHEFGSFTQAVVNGITRLTGFDISEIFGGTDGIESIDIKFKPVMDAGAKIGAAGLGMMIPLQINTKELFKNLEGVKTKTKQVMVDLSDALQSTITEAFVSFGETLGNVFTGDGGANSFFSGILEVALDFAKQLGKIMIGVGTASLALKQSFANPFAAIAAGTALIALSTAAKNLLKKGPETPALAQGGLAYGETLAIVGDNPNAKSDPEVIAPLSKLKGMLGGRDNIHLSGDFRIKGTDLVLTLERAKQTYR